MAIFNIFKRKKKEPKKEPKPLPAKPQKSKEKVSAPPRPKKISREAWRVLKRPQVTEKATDLVQKNQYVFKIFPEANKTDVKKAVQNTYGVDVEAVKIINLPRKKRRLGRIEGWQAGVKKAIVRIKKGQKIEILPR